MAKILIVDDRPVNREFLVTLLGYQDHHLLEASDGAEALEVARAERPDLVIADILMPTMDGYEFVRQIRVDPPIAQTKVIFYTAHYHEREARALAEACGVSHILIKPSEPEEILSTVEAALGTAPPVVEEAPATSEDFDREHLRLMTNKLSEKADELRAVNQQLNAIIDINLQLASETDPGRLLENLCRAAREIIGAKYASVEVTDRNKKSLRHFFISGTDAETATAITAPRRDAIDKLLLDKRSFRIRDLNNDPRSADLPPYRPPISSLVTAAIASPARTYGWLCLTDKIGSEEFSEKDERLVSILAAQAGRVYENGSLYTEVWRRSLELEQEVAERKRAEEALRASEQLFRAVFDNALEAMMITDDEGRFVDVNPAACALFGLPKDDLTGRKIEEFTEPGFDFTGAWSSFIEAGWMTGEFRLVRLDSTTRDLEFSATANILPGRHFSVLRDITRRKQLEEQLNQSQKMEAVGRLAGGIAHDFNNLLTAIIGYSQLTLGRLGESDPMRREVEEIHKAGARAASLTNQLLAFSRKQILKLTVMNLNAIVSDTEKLLGRLIGEDIELITRLDPALWRVKADAGQISQVIMNLAVNARDAMPRGGKLIIETSNITFGDDYTSQHLGVTPGRYIMLAVSDSGTGMDEETLLHLFEPFFTTKGQGKGTGLGLSTVYGIVKQSNGHIWAYSEPGQGATFKIYLPQVGESFEEDETSDEIASPSGTETVLVVEDEEMLRELARRILELSGYTALEAKGGEEAIAICQQYEGAIDLLLTDVVMPQMSGPELAARIASLRPRMKILFMSGYTDSAVLHNSVLDPTLAYIQKPFTMDSLARKVREVLDA